ncbi:radical SAM protein [Pontibacter sp. 172403-2]|uniref:radical SAM/SPASM domain-containing protein n=1 Tax=Pontibacter rufus TaxID=2791028 RepID=UPI0018AF7CD7|nr:radical SAM protein [Pontibacter sp. 172403-2]MBF9254529.1 radical SAM protein [Pontibacter sp. 172403-2]
MLTKKKTSRAEAVPANLQPSGETIISNRWHVALVRIGLLLNGYTLALRHIINPVQALRAVRNLMALNARFMGKPLRKLVKVDGRYHYVMGGPSWPSLAFNRYYLTELNRFYTFTAPKPAQRSVYFAITKKCPLNCEHCFEWDNLNKRETLTLTDLKQIVARFQEQGVMQVQFSGGEPLVRFHDLLELLRTAQKGTDFWIITSGYQLTYEKARQLKEAGLLGVSISLDHHEPAKHDAFRGLAGSYDWVVKAAQNVRKAGLVLNLNLCATKDFISQENLYAYAKLAHELNASFIQLLEPRAVGHYTGKDVALTADQIKLLEEFADAINYDAAFRNWPVVTYPGQHQRHIGCFGAGNRFLYVDTDGDLHACPFCQRKSGNVLHDDLGLCIEKLRTNGCHVFPSAGC